MYKREAEILLNRILDAAESTRNALEFLESDAFTKTPEQAKKLLIDLAEEMLSQQFDLARLIALHQADEMALRKIFSLSCLAVLGVRYKDSPIDVDGILADIQQSIEPLFPGDTLDA